jgi:hypothetical protein
VIFLNQKLIRVGIPEEIILSISLSLLSVLELLSPVCTIDTIGKSIFSIMGF